MSGTVYIQIADIFYIDVAQNNQQRGPVTQIQLYDLFRSGVVNQDTPIWNGKDVTEWTEMRRVPQYMNVPPPPILQAVAGDQQPLAANIQADIPADGTDTTPHLEPPLDPEVSKTLCHTEDGDVYPHKIWERWASVGANLLGALLAFIGMTGNSYGTLDANVLVYNDVVGGGTGGICRMNGLYFMEQEALINYGDLCGHTQYTECRSENCELYSIYQFEADDFCGSSSGLGFAVAFAVIAIILSLVAPVFQYRDAYKWGYAMTLLSSLASFAAFGASATATACSMAGGTGLFLASFLVSLLFGWFFCHPCGRFVLRLILLFACLAGGGGRV